MTGMAITLMIISMLTIWGGLAVALLNLRRHPEVPEADEDFLVAQSPE